MDNLSYDYKPKALSMMFAAAFFAVSGVVLFNAARSNDRGLIIDGLIHLDTAQATLFYWGLTACSAILVVFGVLGIFRSMLSTQKLTLGETALRVPKNALSDRAISVPYAGIIGLKIFEMRGQKILIVTHAHGKTNINRAMLPDKAAFERVCRELNARMLIAKG